MKVFDHSLSLQEQNEMLTPIKNKIRDAFQKHWACNDEAHQESHFEEVLQCGLYINHTLKLMFDPKLILFVAYFHDLFTWDRENHHELVGSWFVYTRHPLIEEYLPSGYLKGDLFLDEYPEHLRDVMSMTDRSAVAMACRTHRASYTGKFRNLFCELMNAADRGFPKDADSLIRRAVKYRKKADPFATQEQRSRDSVKHIKEKFGSGGYARYPELYEKVFAEELSIQRQDVDSLNVNNI